MREDEWRRIADRIESTWPGEPGAGERYRSALDDLAPEAVHEALDGLLISHRTEAPSPRAVRAAARDLEAPSTPDPASRPASGRPPESRRATLALILGVAGLITVPVLVSAAAVVVGTSALREIDATPGLGGARRARTGRVLGWIGLAMMAVAIAVGVVSGLTD